MFSKLKDFIAIFMFWPHLSRFKKQVLKIRWLLKWRRKHSVFCFFYFMNKDINGVKTSALGDVLSSHRASCCDCMRVYLFLNYSYRKCVLSAVPSWNEIDSFSEKITIQWTWIASNQRAWTEIPYRFTIQLWFPKQCLRQSRNLNSKSHLYLFKYTHCQQSINVNKI